MRQAFENASTQVEVQEGQHGGGAGMTCHMFPGGTGTSSRLVKGSEGLEYTVGVLVQTNYGLKHDLHIGGVPIGEILFKEEGDEVKPSNKKPFGGKGEEGSIVIILM